MSKRLYFNNDSSEEFGGIGDNRPLGISSYPKADIQTNVNKAGNRIASAYPIQDSPKEQPKGSSYPITDVRRSIVFEILAEHLPPEKLQMVTGYIDEKERLEFIDPNTLLGNGSYFEQELKEEVARTKRAACDGEEAKLSILYIDLANFKALNDKAGHAVANRALKYFARVLERSVKRETDSAYRLHSGGDEFAVILPDTSYKGAETVASRIQEKVERSLERHKRWMQRHGKAIKMDDGENLLDYLGVTIGIATTYIDKDMPKEQLKSITPKELIAIADEAMREQKKSKRFTYRRDKGQTEKSDRYTRLREELEELLLGMEVAEEPEPYQVSDGQEPKIIKLEYIIEDLETMLSNIETSKSASGKYVKMQAEIKDLLAILREKEDPRYTDTYIRMLDDLDQTLRSIQHPEDGVPVTTKLTGLGDVVNKLVSCQEREYATSSSFEEALQKFGELVKEGARIGIDVVLDMDTEMISESPRDGRSKISSELLPVSAERRNPYRRIGDKFDPRMEETPAA